MTLTKLLLSVISFTLLLTSAGYTVIAGDRDIIKPKSDTRRYKVVKYPNGLEMIFATAADHFIPIPVSAVCFGVRCGYLYDPSYFPGLAHLLEHVLFTGTKTFPEESGFHKFIMTNGGKCDAETHSEFTYFYFFIPSNRLVEALERLSEFFLCPLLGKDGIERELDAVRSEHELKKDSDSYLINTARKQVYDQRHPESKSGVGLAEMPTSDIRKELKRFMKKYWSSHLMKLLVFGPDNPDVCKALEKFAQIRKNEHAKPLDSDEILKDLSREDRLAVLQNPFGDSAGGKLIKVKKNTSGHLLILTFQLPPLRSVHGYGGLESLVAIFQSPRMVQRCRLSGLLTSISSNVASATDYYTLIEIKVDLTRRGLDKYTDVISMILSMISCIGTGNGLDVALDDVRTARKSCFEFDNITFSVQEMIRLTSNLFLFKPGDLLYAGYSDGNADESKIQDLTKYFEAAGMLAILASPMLGDMSKEQYIRIERLDHAKISVDGTKFKLPAKNPYISTDFPVPRQSGEPMRPVPKRIVTGMNFYVWHDLDHIFLDPRASVRIKLHFSETVDFEAFVMACLLVRVVLFQLFELLGQATQAQLILKVSCQFDGVEFWFFGWSQKLFVYIRSVAQTIRRLKLKESVFDLVKEKIIDEIMGEKRRSSIEVAEDTAIEAMSSHICSSEKKLSVVKSLTFKKLKELFDRFLSVEQLSVESLATGNIDEGTAVKVVEDFVGTLFKNFLKGIDAKNRSQTIPLQKKQSSIIIEEAKDPDSKNHAVLFYIQTGLAGDSKMGAVIRLFCTAFSALVFDTLRNKRAIGYDVSLRLWALGEYEGVVIKAQSSSLNPIEMEREIHAMLETVIRSALNKMDSSTFSKIKAATVTASAKIANMYDQTQFYWHNISNHSYNFKKDTNFQIECMSLPDFANAATEKILTPGDRSSLSVHVWSGSFLLGPRYFFASPKAKVYWGARKYKEATAE